MAESSERDFENLTDGRDEMNLSEFPVSVLSERAPKGVTTLQFSKRDWDGSLKQYVDRKLTVEGSSTHGLPAAKDEEVILGLIQVTKSFNNFQTEKVEFKQAELLDLLGWANDGRAYTRLNKAFHRLMGVRLYYENAWRDNSDKQYVTRGGFSIISSFRLNDSRKGKHRDKQITSEFEWSSTFAKSFRDGYLKQLDYSLVRSFKHSVTKRLYRFLDKHFYPPKKMELVFELNTLAFEHLGMSRSRDTFDIKRTLAPAIKELEKVGYIEKCSEEDRYWKSEIGTWKICFQMRDESSPKLTKHPRVRQMEDSSEPLIDLSVFTEAELSHMESIGLDLCQDKQPAIFDGYQRSKASAGPAFSRYREMVIRFYLVCQKGNKLLPN